VIDAKVREMMRADTRSVTPQSALGDVARALADSSRSSLPVVEDGRLVGIIGQSDLLFQEVEDEVDATPAALNILGAFVFLEPLERWREHFRRAFGTTVTDVMTREPVTITAEDTVHEAARRMIDHDVNSLPVVDASGALSGVITRADIVGALAREW
jgi:CBS domain-containing protein